MSSQFFWKTQAVPFHPGETIAAAMRRAGIHDLGPAHGGMRARYFCGIGACQGCLVSVDEASPVEACLTPAKEGMHLDVAFPAPVERSHD